jgi:CHAT domain-containing protein
MLNGKNSIYRRIVVFLLSVWLVVAWLPAHSQSKALGLAVRAQQLYDAGEIAEAALTWQQAAIAFQERGDRLQSTKSYLNQSQALQDLGLYPKACNVLIQALTEENFACEPQELDELIETFTKRTSISKVEAIGLRSLANVLLRQRMLLQSEKLLRLNYSVVKEPEQVASTLLALGNVQHTIANRVRDRWNYDRVTEIIDRQQPEIALEPYAEAFSAYKNAANNRLAPTITRLQARLNYLSLLIEIEDWWQLQTARRIKSWQRLDRTYLIEAAANFSNLLDNKLSTLRNQLITEIEADLDRIRATHEGIYARINFVESLNRLEQTSKVKAILETARSQARKIEDRLGESYALGYLGKYYAQQGQTPRAISLTERALFLAQARVERDTSEIAYLWQSQLGQLLERQGEIDAAIAAYISAYNTLDSLRSDLNINDRVVQFNFRQEVKPIYLKLVDLLLRSPSASSSTNADINTKSDNNLELARQVIESLQIAELDNFFQDPCSADTDVTVTIDRLDPQAAVIYPIILSDRLEIILSVAQKPLQKFTVPVTADTINQNLDLLYDSLYNRGVDNSAVNIFSTTPLNPQELIENTQTLLPILQRLYSWAIEPLETQLAANKIKTLVFVLNGRLQNVPMAALYDGKQYLLQKYGVALAPSLQLIDAQNPLQTKTRVLAAGLSQQVEIQGIIFPALDNVRQELRQIEEIFPKSRKLLNREFTIKNIEQQLQADFPIIHLATHGVFSSDPEQTFIITGDRQTLGIDRLSKLLNSNSNRPELIVLSACDTAAGDERAILGLAGVAVRSGSSTIASIWSVEDAFTTKLMTQFYQEYEDVNTTKVEALQKAQLSLIDSLAANPPLPELKQLPPHPYYWAAYVLVGKWQ